MKVLGSGTDCVTILAVALVNKSSSSISLNMLGGMNTDLSTKDAGGISTLPSTSSGLLGLITWFRGLEIKMLNSSKVLSAANGVRNSISVSPPGAVANG